MRKQNNYYGIYPGIVIQNNDPDNAGKVKVFVPSINPGVYPKWKAIKSDKQFKFIGTNINSDLTPIIEDLKAILPWTPIALPLVGENTSGMYSSFHNLATISDANFVDNDGDKPGHIYENFDSRLSDEFVDAEMGVNRPNPFAHDYIPSTYSNSSKGSFGIPSVGSHVWIFFAGGDPLYPICFATAMGESDWKSIYETKADYPGTFENKTQSTAPYDADAETYRNKYVINQRGASIEIVNSYRTERLKLTHYSGSFKEFNNNTNTELAVKNDQKLVGNDQYITIKGFKNIYVGRDLDEVIRGDCYRKIGNQNWEAFERWKKAVAIIQDTKQLFEIKRAKKLEDDNVKKTSVQQSQSGTFGPHPVTSGTVKYDAVENLFSKVVTSIVKSNLNEVKSYKTVTGEQKPASQKAFPPVARHPSGSALSTSSAEGTWAPDPMKLQLPNLIKSKIIALAEIESEMGLGGSEIVNITKHKIETIGLTMNDFGSMRVDEIGKMHINEILIDDDGVYDNRKESPLIEYVHVDDMPCGTYTLNVCNKFNIQVGAGGVHIGSYGPVNISGTITNIGGEQVNIASEYEVNINGDKRVDICGDIVSIRQKHKKQVLVDSSLGVSKNIIIGGGAHVEGEMFVHHITAPIEIQETEMVKLFSKLLAGLKFTCNLSGGVHVGGPSNHPNWSGAELTLIADSNDDKVLAYDHSHHFKNIPLTLLPSNKNVRLAAKSMNGGNVRSVATEVKHKKK